MSDNNTTAFFGGSFDPPHPGHLGVALGALNSGKCRKILWVPAYAPPHKMNRNRMPFEKRCEMVEKLINDFPDMELSDIEKRLALDPSYTISVLENLAQEISGDIALLIGADSLLQLHTWHRAHELVDAFRILTYPRSKYPVSALKEITFWSSQEQQKLLSGVIEGKFFEISSTIIRKKMAKNAEWSDIKQLTDEIMKMEQ